MRVAIVHDWLTGTRGGERVLVALLELFPAAEIFTLLHVAGSVPPVIEERPLHTSLVQRLPGAARRYRYYLPLFPAAIERFDLSGFDLVVSSSHCVAKGVRAPSGVPHLCYCHTPMRYVWDGYDDYFGPGRGTPAWIRAAAPVVAHRLRRWDRAASARVDAFVANSEHVRGRIRRCYGREAAVVHPPVDVDRFRPGPREDFDLIVSALVPYKRVDLAVEAYLRLGRPLVVVGEGPELPRLRRIAAAAGAAGVGVRFTGRLSDREVADLMGRCRAFLMPQEEDFGITAVEAQAAGAPVIAYRSGGAMETVIDADPGESVIDADPGESAISADRGGPVSDVAPADAGAATGVFFHPQSVDALCDAVHRSEALRFDPAALARNARRFTKAAFLEGMRVQVQALLTSAGRAEAPPAAVPPTRSAAEAT